MRKVESADRRELLRKWLLHRGYHAIDIKAGLDYYDKMMAEGKPPTDEDILGITDKSHKVAIGELKLNSIQQVKKFPVWLSVLCGGLGAVLVEVGKWLWMVYQ